MIANNLGLEIVAGWGWHCSHTIRVGGSSCGSDGEVGPGEQKRDEYGEEMHDCSADVGSSSKC